MPSNVVGEGGQPEVVVGDLVDPGLVRLAARGRREGQLATCGDRPDDDVRSRADAARQVGGDPRAQALVDASGGPMRDEHPLGGLGAHDSGPRFVVESDAVLVEHLHQSAIGRRQVDGHGAENVQRIAGVARGLEIAARRDEVDRRRLDGSDRER